MEKYKAYKFDESRVTGDMNVDEIILHQFFTEFPNDIHASELYMPEEEQDKMAEWIMKNQKDFKRLRTKTSKQRNMQWVRLDIFPSAVEE